MKEIFFKGRKIFEFDDSNGIQVIGSNTYFITLIVDIYMKVFNGYRYSDIDIDAMNGYYPEVREDGEILTKKELSVIQISDLEDVINQLTLKKNSILIVFCKSKFLTFAKLFPQAPVGNFLYKPQTYSCNFVYSINAASLIRLLGPGNVNNWQ
jgi:hypothetical protein